MTIEANDDDRAGDVEAEPTDEQLRVQKAQAIWSKIAQCLRLQMTKATYDMHFGQAVCSGFNSSDQVLVVSVVSQYAREWIEARLISRIRGAGCQGRIRTSRNAGMCWRVRARGRMSWRWRCCTSIRVDVKPPPVMSRGRLCL